MMKLCVVLIFGVIAANCELKWLPAQSSNMDAAASIAIPQELAQR
jgi:hypothetical protein